MLINGKEHANILDYLRNSEDVTQYKEMKYYAGPHDPERDYDGELEDLLKDVLDGEANEEITLLNNSVIKIETLDSKGGHEGGGEECWRVFKLTYGDNEEIWRLNGSYYSYHGTDWYDYERVEAKVVERTEWVKCT